MPALCPHGLPASECLICPTLPRPIAAGTPGRKSGPNPAVHVAALAAALVVLGLAAWALVGVVFGLLHVVELIAVAIAAGWVGYRIGHFRGRRQPR